MKIKQVNDKYLLAWTAHIESAKTVPQWCWETFGSGWGEFKLGVPNNIGICTSLVIFHKLSHANWFSLKFKDFDN